MSFSMMPDDLIGEIFSFCDDNFIMMLRIPYWVN